MTQQTRVVITNDVIHSFLQRPEIVSEFPFMQHMAAKAQKKKGCGRCGNKNKVNLAEYEGVKTAIAQMGQDKKKRLKELLGASEVRLVFKNFRNQTIRQTF